MRVCGPSSASRSTSRRGVAGSPLALLEAAVEHAVAHGATSVEAYAHVADPRDYMGHTALYAQAGFEHVRDANKRAVVRSRRSRS
jgi:hypothetical protein